MNRAVMIADAAASLSPRAGRSAVLVGISGIDASGKSTLARQVATSLTAKGVRCASLSIDWFHTSAHQRLLPSPAPAGSIGAGEHFYLNAFRWNELFGAVIDPLIKTGACDADVGVHDMQSDQITPQRIVHTGIRAVVLEGIFIFRRDWADRFDLRVWLDCSFETALQRALARNQEGLAPEAMRSDYERIYFPAQRHHQMLDRPCDGPCVLMVPPSDP